MIDDGAIGEPQYCLIELWRRPYRPGSGGWRSDIDRVGNWILEEPIHFFELVQQIQRVAEAVRNGTPLYANGHDGLWAVRMCMSAAESAKSGRAVNFH